MRHVEDTLQRSCVQWFDWTHPTVAMALFHVPNGGKRSVREAAKLKAMGVRPGVPDLILLLPSCGYHYLAIELKVGKNAQTPRQREYQEFIGRHGGRYAVVRSLDQFIEEIENYLTERTSIPSTTAQALRN